MKSAAAVSASSPAYSSFRAERLASIVSRQRAVGASLAALAVVAGTFAGAMLMSPPASEAALFAFPDKANCLKAGHSLAPWFENEQRRAARTGTHRFQDFDEMLTVFQNAQKQCAEGGTEHAVSDFQDLANQIAKLEESRSWRTD